MKKIKSIIIDDEAASLRSLKYEVENYCTDIEVLASFQDPIEAKKFIIEQRPELLFLDIEMPRLNGFELLQSLPDLNFDVIFITAYDEFAVRAFEFNAIDYLLKPILKEKLIKSVTRVKEKREKRITPQDLVALIYNINRRNPESPSENIAIPSSEGFEIIPVGDIIYLEAESNYTWVRLKNNQNYLVSRSLKEVAKMINSDKFLRTHKSFFVNVNHVRKFIKGRTAILVLIEGFRIPVSRTYAPDVKSTLNI